MGRLQRFLLAPEREASQVADASGPAADIVFRDADLAYGDSTTPLLKSVTATLRAGQLTAIAGPVGSGKSNVLMAILDQMQVLRGQVKTGGRMAYVPQNPWCALGTVRENILFGQPYDEARYRRVLHACALEMDMQQLECGDETYIGERGLNLSGGQKQRIALARAAYSGAPTFLLDAPLSALDMYTCTHVFQHCIRDIMVASGATVVLVTHQVELLPYADQVLILRDGSLAYAGPYSGSALRPFYPDVTLPDGPATGTLGTPASVAPVAGAAGKGPATTEGKLVHEKTEGNVALPAADATEAPINGFGVFIRRMTLPLFIIFWCGHLPTQVVRVYSDIWINDWVGKKWAPQLGYPFYVGVYGAFVGVFITCVFIRSLYWWWMARRAAWRLHESMFKAVLAAPMAFFTRTPLGGVLSSFSRDIDTIDSGLQDEWYMCSIESVIIVQTSGVAIYTFPTFAVIAAAGAVIFIFCIRWYVLAAQQIKDKAGSAANAVVGNVGETLQGLDVIHAYKAQDRYRERNLALVDVASQSGYNLDLVQLWLCFRLDTLACLLVLASMLLALQDKTATAGQAGLAVSNSFQILLFMSLVGKRCADINSFIASVERVERLSLLEPERDMPGTMAAPAGWPAAGEVRFQGVVMAYAEGLPTVLKGVDFCTKAGEKIGVVGRTGAGKSSLIMALFRLAELSEGLVKVDGVDARSLQLAELRRHIAIIPQEPVMFHGTVRSNLDPFDQRSDKELLDALSRCLLGDLASKPDALSMEVAHMGSNFSLGQQQLICLARAMLNPSKLLLLDEATAALDSDTDAAVQRVLRSQFADRTMITIAHRLDTIIDSDRILVMNAGVVVEFDTPCTLLNRQSVFAELCRQTGGQFEALRAAAESHEATRAGKAQ